MTFSEFYEAPKFKSDKGTTHDYINGFYSDEFTPKRNDRLSILEIGVHRGPSIKLLKDWFINSNITGIDPFGDGLPETMADDIRKMVTELPQLDGVVFCAGVVEYYPIKFINVYL